MSCRAKGKRHDKAVGILGKAAAMWKEAGIEIGCIPVSVDAGYADSGFMAAVRGLGFGKILAGGKSSFLLRPARYEKAEAPIKRLLGRNRMGREPTSACKERVGLLKGFSLKFGKPTVCVRHMPGMVRWVFAFRVDRACEIVRVWQSHHGVEAFFKRMKHLLSFEVLPA